MTRIDFYILGDVDNLAKRRFACRLSQKALQAGRRVYVRAGAEHAGALDELMWDYPPDGFLPHAPLPEATSEPIVIGPADRQPGRAEVLINLERDIPTAAPAAAFFARFERVAEVVLASERSIGRDKYRHYRERGYPLFHHEIDDWE